MRLAFAYMPEFRVRDFHVSSKDNFRRALGEEQARGTKVR